MNSSESYDWHFFYLADYCSQPALVDLVVPGVNIAFPAALIAGLFYWICQFNY